MNVEAGSVVERAGRYVKYAAVEVAATVVSKRQSRVAFPDLGNSPVEATRGCDCPTALRCESVHGVGLGPVAGAGFGHLNEKT